VKKWRAVARLASWSEASISSCVTLFYIAVFHLFDKELRVDENEWAEYLLDKGEEVEGRGQIGLVVRGLHFVMCHALLAENKNVLKRIVSRD
jgi:hypothetical protein